MGEKIVGENIAAYIRLKGYSRASFAQLVGISRPILNQILSGEGLSPTILDEQVERITNSLSLPRDYFLTPPVIRVEKWREPIVSVI